MWKMAEPLAAGSPNECVQEGHLATRKVLCQTVTHVISKHLVGLAFEMQGLFIIAASVIGSLHHGNQHTQLI